MSEHNQEKLSDKIKVKIDHGVVMVDHSDAYNDLEIRALAKEKFTKQERNENYKFIEAEEAQIALAHMNPEAYMKQQGGALAKSNEGRTETSAHSAESDATEPTSSSLNNSKVHSKSEVTEVNNQEISLAILSEKELSKLSKVERHNRAEKAFATATYEDAKAAGENLKGLESELKKSTAKLPHNIASAVIGAGLEEGLLTQGELLIQIAAAKAKTSNQPTTNDLANFVQPEGKTLLTNTIVAANGKEFSNTTTVLHGTGKVPLLGATSLGITTLVDSGGNVAAGVLGRAAQEVYKDDQDGTHKIYLAEEAALGGSNLMNDAKLNFALTSLIANTHLTAGMPTTEIVSHTFNPLTGQNITGVSVDVIPNPDSNHHIDLRAYGNFEHESKQFGAGGEVYFKVNEAAKLYIGGGVDNIGSNLEGYNGHTGIQIQL